MQRRGALVVLKIYRYFYSANLFVHDCEDRLFEPKFHMILEFFSCHLRHTLNPYLLEFWILSTLVHVCGKSCEISRRKGQVIECILSDGDL